MIENSYLPMSPNAAYERRRWVIIVLDNGLTPVQHQAIIYPIFFFLLLIDHTPRNRLKWQKKGKISKLINSH